MPEPDEATSEDRLLDGAVRLLQPRRGHRAGTDAVLLAGTADLRPGDRVLDLGSASGAVGLMLAHRMADARITFVEREPDLVALCRRNIALNGFHARAAAFELDLFAPPDARRRAGLASGSADLVVTNPPFMEAGARASPDPGRRAAHAMRGGDLRAWLASAADLLVPRGRLAMIHRADRLAECLDALAGCFGSLVVTPVHPREDAPASRILIGALKGGRAPLRIDPPLVLHRPDGSFTERADAMHRARS